MLSRVECQCLVCRAVESEDATETEALLSAAEQGQAGTGKFFYFSTFVQAALIVHELHLLDIASLRQVPPPSMYLNIFSMTVHAYCCDPRHAAVASATRCCH